MRVGWLLLLLVWSTLSQAAIDPYGFRDDAERARFQALTRELGVVIAASDAVIEAARSSGGHAAVEGFVELPPRPLRGRERPVGVWSWPAPVGTAAPHGLLSPPDQTR